MLRARPGRACWSAANDVSCHVMESAFTGPRAAESWLRPVAYFAGAWKWDAAAIPSNTLCLCLLNLAQVQAAKAHR